MIINPSMTPIDDLPVSFLLLLADFDAAVAVIAEGREDGGEEGFARVVVNKVQQRMSVSRPEGKAQVSVNAPHPHGKDQWRRVGSSD